MSELVKYMSTAEAVEHGKDILLGLLTTMKISDIPVEALDRVATKTELPHNPCALLFGYCKEGNKRKLSDLVSQSMNIAGQRMTIVPEDFDMEENVKRIDELEKKVKRQNKALNVLAEELAQTRIDAALKD